MISDPELSPPPETNHVRSRRPLILLTVVGALGALGFLWSAVLNQLGSCATDLWQRLVQLAPGDFAWLLGIFAVTGAPMVVIITIVWRRLSRQRGLRWVVPLAVAATIVSWMSLFALFLIQALDGGGSDPQCAVLDIGYRDVAGWIVLGAIAISTVGLVTVLVIHDRVMTAAARAHKSDSQN